jgi:hypothetical protein
MDEKTISSSKLLVAVAFVVAMTWLFLDYGFKFYKEYHSSNSTPIIIQGGSLDQFFHPQSTDPQPETIPDFPNLNKGKHEL